jgi:hypothetical protein
MPTENPAIVITNSPTSARRVIHCRFEHGGATADIEIPNAFDPEISPGIERVKADRLLVSLATALAERLGQPHNPIITLTGYVNGTTRNVGCSFEHSGVTAQIRIPNSVSSSIGAGGEIVEARRLLLSMAEALVKALKQ